MPKVDIIIPAYNAAKYLPSAIESVIAQTFDDWKILLVDDGSTDDTREVISSFADRLGERLQYIYQNNKGLPAARNTAIRNSTAEFLALLDADDVWLPSRLEESVKSFEGRPQCGLSYGMIRYIDVEGKTSEWEDRRQKNAEGRIAAQIYMRKVNLPCPTVTFRRLCVAEVGLFDETMRATEDRDMWLRIALKYEVCFIERVIAHYRLSPTSMSTDLNRMLTAQLKFVEKHRGAPGCGTWQRREALGFIYRQYADSLSARKQLGAALRSSLRALALFPFDLNNARAAASIVMRWARISS
jgi:cellulose synthase/poly-beta-1,6-N-acetylglucosamine synthase-like glycosyltransferase